MKLKKLLCLFTVPAMLLNCSIPAFAEDECMTVKVNNAETSYTSFEEGWNKAVSAGAGSEVTVTLLKNWNGSSGGSLGSGTGFRDGALNYSGSKNLTLDLNGFTLNRNLYSPQDGGAVIYVDSKMTIIDSGKDNYSSSKLFRGGAITGGSNSDKGGGIVISDNAVLDFNGGTILNCVSTDEGGGISINGAGAKLNVNGGSFYGNRTYDAWTECVGGAICSFDATINIANSVFEGNYAEDSGGALYIYGGNLTVSNSQFRSNASLEDGGAAYLCDEAKSSFENCTFTENSSSEDDGGAVYCLSDEGTYFYNCNMYYNSSASEGGAIHVEADKVFITGGNYQYNTASEQGGGIYVDSLFDINISGRLVVKDNTAGGKEADLCLQDGTASTAYLYCGGLYEGSSVYICSTDSDSRLAIKGIDKYQYDNYIHFDSGFSQDKVVKSSASQDNIRAEGSAIGSGRVLYIIALAVIIIAAVVIILAIKKKKGVKEKDAEENP